jgi:macrodomain Ter protein organizer (MatP/YcbG family)
MAKLNKLDFIQNLLRLLEGQRDFGYLMNKLDEGALNTKPNAKSWSILECIEHMNLSMLIYIDQFKELQLSNIPESTIRVGWKGTFFAEGMRPKENAISYKMKTAKKLTPASKLSSHNISSFLNNIQTLVSFIETNKAMNWNTKKVKTAIGSLVKLNVGEALNFVIAHNERHIWQAQNVITVINKAA